MKYMTKKYNLPIAARCALLRHIINQYLYEISKELTPHSSGRIIFMST